jgi:hypothetical protein
MKTTTTTQFYAQLYIGDGVKCPRVIGPYPSLEALNTSVAIYRGYTVPYFSFSHRVFTEETANV